MSEHRVTLGRVAGAYGVKGWIKITSFTRPEDNILSYRCWWIAKGEGYETRVLQSRPQGAALVAQISGTDGQVLSDRDQAERLIGAEIQVSRNELPATQDGQHYWADLVGLQVCSERGEELGAVAGLISNGAQDVLMVRDDEQERLIPFVHGAIIKSVDMVARRIVVDWSPEF